MDILTVWNTLLVHPIMNLTLFAYSIVHDFGLAVIFVTITIRLALYPLYVTQIRSQRAMQEVAPAMEELKKKYGKDRQRFSQEQMKLYKERGVNPAAGCLPLVLQMPLLIALYNSLRYKFEPTAAAAGVFAIVLVVLSMLLTNRLTNLARYAGIKFS